MNTRAANFVRDWALQHVGPGANLAADERETEDLVTDLIEACRKAGIARSAVDGFDLRTLILNVRAMRNGGPALRWPLKARRLQKVSHARAATLEGY
jgi:hypothetical protein